MIHWLRNLWLLRHPELTRLLGQQRLAYRELQALRDANPGAKIAEGARVIGDRRDLLVIEPGASIGHGTLLATGDEQNGFGRIIIGPRTWLGEYNNLRASAEGDIRIGADCLISQFCSLVGTNHGTAAETPIATQPPCSKRRGVTVDDDVWLGAGVVLTPGVHVGSGAVVGAGAVVTQDVPPGEIWGGIPARRIGVRS